MTKRDIIGAGSALRTLVHQFSDPLSFYRELVQNALDAGSLYVDIQMDYTESGKTKIIVEDSGRGMTSEIIDSQLTCLFSSQKDDDLTLIGKFGIGFVSVFALAPELVTVETAGDGEAWQIDFFQDGSFERRALDGVREGTRITLLKPSTLEEFQDLKARSEKVILYWCKHVNGEISFCGNRMERPFGIDVDCPVVWSEPGTEIHLGYPADFQSFTGFYNQGLTLLESNKEHLFAGLAVKINSRFLEHTLTRDQVVEDEHFAKLLSQVADLIEHELPHKLLETLEQREIGREECFEALLAHYRARPLRTVRNSELEHPRGRASGDQWVCRPAEDPPGFLCKGPGLVNLGQVETCQAVFRLQIPSDRFTDREMVVADLQVADSTAKVEGGLLARREVKVGDFETGSAWTDLCLDFLYEKTLRLDFKIDWKGQVPLFFREVLVQERVDRKLDFQDRKLDHSIFRSPSGRKVSLSAVHQAHLSNSLFVTSHRSALSEAAENSQLTVLLMHTQSSEWRFLRLLLQKRLKLLTEEFVFPQVLSDPVPVGLKQSLINQVLSWGTQLRDVRLAICGCDQSWPAVVVAKIGVLQPFSTAIAGSGHQHTMLLNAENPFTQRILNLAETDDVMAAYLLCRQFLLQIGSTERVDSRLALQAWRQAKK